MKLNGLANPVVMTLRVDDDPPPSCAFWDEETAKWSSEGVETLTRQARLLRHWLIDISIRIEGTAFFSYRFHCLSSGQDLEELVY